MLDDRRVLRFDGTQITLIQDRPLRHLSGGLYVPANTRGLMAAGMAAEFRLLAGRGVEQELRAHVPLAIGAAAITGVGQLAEQGVLWAAHAVSVREPGTAPRVIDLERSFKAALAALEERGVRDITLPLATEQLARPTSENAALMARLLTAHLRQNSRLKTIVVAGLDASFLEEFARSMESQGAAFDANTT